MNVKVVEFRVVVELKGGTYRDYDFEWSKKHQRYLYHDSAGGHTEHTVTEDEYWATPDARFDIYPERGATRREHYDPTSLFEDNWECEVEWCNQCDDWIDHDEPCVHLHWHDELGWWVEVTYCCDELKDDPYYEFDVHIKEITRFSGVPYSKCPFCSGLPTYSREG